MSKPPPSSPPSALRPTLPPFYALTVLTLTAPAAPSESFSKKYSEAPIRTQFPLRPRRPTLVPTASPTLPPLYTVTVLSLTAALGIYRPPLHAHTAPTLCPYHCHPLPPPLLPNCSFPILRSIWTQNPLRPGPPPTTPISLCASPTYTTL